MRTRSHVLEIKEDSVDYADLVVGMNILYEGEIYKLAKHFLAYYVDDKKDLSNVLLLDGDNCNRCLVIPIRNPLF